MSLNLSSAAGAAVTQARRHPEILRACAIGVVAYIAFSIAESGFSTINNLYTIVEGLVFLGLGALAFGLTMIAGELDLAVPSTAAVAGVVALLYTDTIITGLLMGILCGLIIGLVQGLLVWRIGLHSVVITLGTSTALLGIAELFSPTTLVLRNLDLASQIQHRLFIFSPGSFIAIGLFGLAGFGLQRTRWGAEIRAIGGGRNEAIASGIPMWRPIITVFTVSGIISAILGVLASLSVGSVGPPYFQNLLLQAVAAALIGGVSLYGGRGTAFGIAVGVLTLRFVISGMSLGGNKFFVINMAIGLLLLLVVIIEIASDRGALARYATYGKRLVSWERKTGTRAAE